MKSEDRRRALLALLHEKTEPISASALASRLGVSRQIIVGDVALLRSAGEKITATPRGYLINVDQPGLCCQIAVCHRASEMEAELNAIVDNGCTVLDVIVEHPLYGQLTGQLQLASRYEIGQFMQRCAQAEAHPLSNLTGGIHLHTLLCPDENALLRVKDDLRELGILQEDREG